MDLETFWNPKGFHKVSKIAVWVLRGSPTSPLSPTHPFTPQNLKLAGELFFKFIFETCTNMNLEIVLEWVRVREAPWLMEWRRGESVACLQGHLTSPLSPNRIASTTIRMRKSGTCASPLIPDCSVHCAL